MSKQPPPETPYISRPNSKSKSVLELELLVEVNTLRKIQLQGFLHIGICLIMKTASLGLLEVIVVRAYAGGR
jgi:hypothetical protein